MPTLYLPTKEGELRMWTMGLARGVAVSPGDYGVSVEMSDAYTELAERFDEVMSLALAPETRTSVMVTRKNEIKKELIAATRAMVNQMQGWSGMTLEKRATLGLTIRRQAARQSPEMPRPVLMIGATFGRETTIELRDRPAGALGAMIYVAYTDHQDNQPKDWTLLTITGKRRTAVTLGGVQAPCTAWITACWFNGRKQQGDMSLPRYVELARMTQLPSSIARAAA